MSTPFLPRFTCLLPGLPLPFLISGEEFSVYERKEDICGEKEEQLSVDELVQGPLPLEEDSGEATGGRAGDITLVGDSHL